MKGVSGKLLALAVGALSVPYAGATEDEPVDQPPVVVHRYTVDEIFVYCAGVDCLDAFTEIGGNPWPMLDISISSEGGSATTEEFCSALRSKRPAGCDLTNPPSTPGTDPNWQPNGCGTDMITNSMLSFGLSQFYSDNYSGDIDAPFAGVSFLAACNAHDVCWAEAKPRYTCDDTFRGSMDAACGTHASPDGQSVCRGFSSAYHSAVSATDLSNKNYSKAVSNHKCALWAFDMALNQCGP